VVDRSGVPLVVCGLDYWYIQEPHKQHAQQPAQDVDEFKFSDWRLVEQLAVDHFRRPPDYRSVLKGQTAPPNAFLHIPTFRLPRWYVCTRSSPKSKGFRPMVYVGADVRNSRQIPVPKPPGKGRMVPVRFISICPDGHLDDFPWARWLGCPVEADGQTPRDGHELSLRDLGGENLSSIRVRCICGKEQSLQGITRTRIEPRSEQFQTTLTDELNKRNGPPAGFCRGRRPWIGPDAFTHSCGKPVVGALLSGSNVYFARTQTSIYIPQDTAAGVEDIVAELQRELCKLPKFLNIKMKWQSGQRQDALDAASAPLRRAVPALKDRDEDEEQLLQRAIEAAVEGRPVLQAKAPVPSGPERADVSYRRVEFNSLRQAYDNRAEPDLRIREVGVPESLREHVERVRLVEKLRASRVFLGFDRVKPGTKYGREAAEDALNQLFRAYPADEESRWLPGVETRGEGLYIELKESAIQNWLAAEETRTFLGHRLSPGYCQRLNSERFLAPLTGLAGDSGTEWVARYLLVHGLAHALINQFVFECGYSTAALRERLYVSSDARAPMAAMLIYTAAGDSEGTLGGLVRLGREERLGATVAHGLKRIAWCSADPVCSEVDAQGPDASNKAACHACLLLPETSCETINRGLDRAVLTGTPLEPDRGFFSALSSCLLVGPASAGKQ
jgi:hypothetical protein